VTNGYHHVKLSRDNRVAQRSIHALVAEAFLGPRPDGYEINHMDGLKTNNRPENLEYTTRQGNADHASIHGLLPSLRGAANGMYGRRSSGFTGRLHTEKSRALMSAKSRGNTNRIGTTLSAKHLAALRAGHADHYTNRR